MTIRELIHKLQQQDQNATVLVLKSKKQQTFVTIEEVEATHYDQDKQEVGFAKLTDKLKKLGYTEKDLLVDPVKAVILWNK